MILLRFFSPHWQFTVRMFFSNGRQSYLFYSRSCFTALGIASKTNVWVTAIAIVIALFIQAFISPARTMKAAIYAIAFLIAVPVLSVINPLTQYVANYQTYGKPVLMNINTLPLPPLVGITKYNDRGGILSIRDGFFTFKFANLLEHPRLEFDHDNYPPSRTSFWTMLYANGNSASFNNYPPSWSTTGTQGFMLARGIFILAFLPVLMLFAGALAETFVFLRSIFKQDYIGDKNTSYGLFILTFIWLYFFCYFVCAVLSNIPGHKSHFHLSRFAGVSCALPSNSRAAVCIFIKTSQMERSYSQC